MCVRSMGVFVSLTTMSLYFGLCFTAVDGMVSCCIVFRVFPPCCVASPDAT